MTEKDIEMFRHFNVPPLKVHPETYLKQMMALHTGYSWWWNTDMATGKPIITNIHPHTEFKVMNDEAWYQEDFTKDHLEINLNKSFFDQLYTLATTVPISAQKNFEKPHNSIARHSFGDKDSYFVEGSISNKLLFGSGAFHVEDSMEVTYSQNITQSYNVSHCSNLNRCIVARESRDCISSSFIFDCRDCEFSFMSSNKRHRKYLFYNEQLTEQEWKARMSEMDLSDFDVFQNYESDFAKLMSKEAIWPENFNEKCENVNGEYLNNCVNAERAWFSDGAKNIRWALWDNFTSDDNAVGIDPGSTHGYGNPASVNSSNCRFCYFATRSQNCEYCFEVYDSEHCFGCVGLRRKKFCIFNKPYTEEEYWEKLDALKCTMLDRGEYGDLFPQHFALTPFQHTPFQAVFEGTPEIKKQLGVRDFDASFDGAYGDWQGKEMREIDEMPKKIDKVGDEWIGRPIMDRSINRPFAVLAPELAFYRKMRLPLRRGHFVPRIEAMLFSLSMFEQIHVSCAKCGTLMTASKNTAYPERKIYCRACYLQYLETSK